MSKTPQMQLAELKRGRTIEQLIRQGVERGWTQDQIAEDLEISRPALKDWCRRLGLRIVQRSFVEQTEDAVGVR